MKRGLKNRHLQMIALGGAIGTGLFYGSTSTIALAGPSVMLAYLMGGIVLFFMTLAFNLIADYIAKKHRQAGTSSL